MESHCRQEVEAPRSLRGFPLLVRRIYPLPRSRQSKIEGGQQSSALASFDFIYRRAFSR
jgi:hypothetical protein